MNEYVRPHWWVGNKEVAGNQIVLAPSIIFAAPIVAGTYIRKRRGANIPPYPVQFVNITSPSTLQLYPNGFGIR